MKVFMSRSGRVTVLKTKQNKLAMFKLRGNLFGIHAICSG
jgi:hypothetical protein